MEPAIEKTASNYAAMSVVPFHQGVSIEHHKASALRTPYHFHPSIEINYLHNCVGRYSFSGREFVLPKNRLIIFWAAHPHRLIEVKGEGEITVANITLPELLKWSLPGEFTNLLITGAVLSSKSRCTFDENLAERWAKEAGNAEVHWSNLHAKEIESRLHRLNVEGWVSLLEPANITSPPNECSMGGPAVFQFERMMRFVTDHFMEPVSVEDVAAAGNFSPNYANSFFKKLMGKSIKRHVIEMRISHAKMLLSESNLKIATVATESGFTSQSAFYDAFKKNEGSSPATFRNNAHHTRMPD